MKSRLFLCVLAVILFLMMPPCLGATTVFETTGWIIGPLPGAYNFDFVADQSPYTYKATLSDLSILPFGFDVLFLQISTATDSVGSIFDHGSFTFTAVPDETYYANVFGVASEESIYNAGLFGVEVTAIPIPATLMLLGSGLVGLLVLKRKSR